MTVCKTYIFQNKSKIRTFCKLFGVFCRSKGITMVLTIPSYMREGMPMTLVIPSYLREGMPVIFVIPSCM